MSVFSVHLLCACTVDGSALMNEVSLLSEYIKAAAPHTVPAAPCDLDQSW